MPSYLISVWCQQAKKEPISDLGEWLNAQLGHLKNNDVDIDYGSPSITHIVCANIQQIIKNWGEVFGEEKLIFFIPDPNDRNALFRAVEKLLGVGELLEDPDLKANISPPYEILEVLRKFRQVHDRKGEERIDWEAFFHSGIRDYLWSSGYTSKPGKIAPPRWLVDPCNLATEKWIETLRQSLCTVIGDPRNLLVSTDGLSDEIVVPQTVGVDVASEMMAEIYRAALSSVEKVNA